MYWFERKAEEIEDIKKFIDDVLRLFTTSLAGEGGIQLGRYIAEIESYETKSKFLDVVKEVLLRDDTENWIKEELEVAKEVIEVRERELSRMRAKVTVRAAKERLRV